MAQPDFIYPVGMLVRHASGGPVMTVVDIHPERGTVTAAWRSGAVVSEYEFTSVALDLARNVTH